MQQLEKEIAELLEDLDQLTQQACPGLRKTYGIAVDGAATLLVAAGDNPARLRSDAAFAALCGVSPLPASSGKTNRHRLNRGGNRQANATLHRVVVVRLRWHEQTKAYAARRMEEGRSKPEIMKGYSTPAGQASNTYHSCLVTLLRYWLANTGLI